MTKETEEVLLAIVPYAAGIITAMGTVIALLGNFIVRALRDINSSVSKMATNLDGKMDSLLDAASAKGKYEGFKEGLATPVTTIPVKENK